MSAGTPKGSLPAMHRLRFGVSVAVILVGGLLFAIPGSAQPAAPALSSEARAGLLDAAKGNALPAWQREFMIGVAGDSTPVEGTASNGSATGADGTWPGLYFCEVRATGSMSVQRFVLVR